MRLSEKDLLEITNRTLPVAQARWFKRYFGIDVEYDRRGVIMTRNVFEQLVAKKCGISAKTEARPSVKLLKEKIE